jgi:hypothetical protein
MHRATLIGWTRPDATTRSGEGRRTGRVGGSSGSSLAPSIRSSLDSPSGSSLAPSLHESGRTGRGGRSGRAAGRSSRDDELGRAEPPQRPGRNAGGSRFGGGGRA